MRAKLTQAQQQISKYKDGLTQILCDINVQFEKSVDLTNTSTKIAQYLSKTMQLINEGLLVAGENIEIEYINGFAKIHARIPDYEPRPVPKRECFDSTPIELVYPAPPCPPLVPGCPSCPETTTTTSAAPATTTAASTTTTEAPGCYLAVCYHTTSSVSTKMYWYLCSSGSTSVSYPFPGSTAGYVVGMFPTLSQAQSALNTYNCSSKTGWYAYVFNVTPTKFGITNGSTKTQVTSCSNGVTLVGSWVDTGVMRKIDPTLHCAYAANWQGLSQSALCASSFY
jgi:hypothetical protein